MPSLGQGKSAPDTPHPVTTHLPLSRYRDVQPECLARRQHIGRGKEQSYFFELCIVSCNRCPYIQHLHNAQAMSGHLHGVVLS